MLKRASAEAESGCAKIYGHRGARGEAPENTMAGFRHAIAAGVAGIETDIAVTADFCAVLHHDPYLADGRLIRDLAFAELPGIPTLAEALIAFPATEWLLEIKTFPATPAHSHPPRIMVRAVRAAIIHAGIDPARLRILAFDWSVLREVREQAPDLRLVCLTAPAQESARDLWWGTGYGAFSTPQAAARFGAHAWSPLHKTLTADDIAEAHALGLQVMPWTVNEPDDLRRLAPLADGLTTDFPTSTIKLLSPR